MSTAIPPPDDNADAASPTDRPTSSGSTAAGTTFADFLPIPHDMQPVTDPSRQDLATSLGEETTLSHALATGDHEEKGTAQLQHVLTAETEDVVNLGWNEDKKLISEPLVGGLDNEELWLLVRRFNKQLYHVKEVPDTVPGNLDLNVSDSEEFSPDKLRASVERLYMTVIVGSIGAVKHIARLRSWRETRRTSIFCAFYFTAWMFNFLIPLLCATVITLIAYTPSRSILFPPAPISLVDSKTGGIQKPKSGVLGSHDSATGAPENHKGEAVEQEASNFWNGITSIVITSATGKHPQSEPESSDSKETDPTAALPDPSAIAMSAAKAKDVAARGENEKGHDKTKVPVENAMWTKMRPVMHTITEITDTWERFANALSPTPPFPQEVVRIRLATIVLPLLLISLTISSHMFTKGVTFGIGFGFFGDPVISRGLALLDRKFPHWQRLLELRNTVLKGIPTNAQLTLTLLRVGEANKAPLPPPPRIREAPPEQPTEVTDEHFRATGAEPPLNATDAEIEEAMQHDPQTAHETGGSDIDAAKGGHKHGGKIGSKILSIFKGTTKGTVKTAIGFDAVRAKVGSKHAKHRLGAVPSPREDLTSGPVDFIARYKGHKGHIFITTKATIPCIAFSSDSTTEKIGDIQREDLHPLWTIPIGDIRELKKMGGYGWKAKILVGWSLSREVVDGLEIVDRTGAKRSITALPLRDELFNRLIAMGGQKWEAW